MGWQCVYSLRACPGKGLKKAIEYAGLQQQSHAAADCRVIGGGRRSMALALYYGFGRSADSLALGNAKSSPLAPDLGVLR
jgi:hypothetical protein